MVTVKASYQCNLISERSHAHLNTKETTGRQKPGNLQRKQRKY